MPPFLFASDELVTRAWIAQISGFTTGMVGERLPRDVSTWSGSGFVTVAVAGGDTVPEFRFESPVMDVRTWATSPGTDEPPWNQARNLALAIQAATYRLEPWFVPLDAASENAVVKTAYVLGKPRRAYGDFGDFAVYAMNLALHWVPVAKSTP
ncbi:hypothetical protein ACIOD2_27255 [Amycolatopsis sp. NPDC088138]|uniref:hypothetical protein n=1 Tax=Amycolatopsis sp. NPDC088138 TaxID=3363938 RepID=UPI0038049040